MSEKKSITQIFQEAVEDYSGMKVEKINIYKDPKVAGCVAARIKYEGEEDYCYFIKTHSDPINADTIEECEMPDGFPPKSGKLKFF